MKLKRLILLLICMVLFFAAVPRASAEQQTLLIYMLACDLETDSGAATKDLLEVLRASAVADGLRIIAYIGGAEKLWFAELEHEHCYDLLFNDGEYTILNDLGRVPSAEQSSVLRFLNAYGEDGADLVFWGHGNGESCELGFDDLFERNTLNVEEITGALRESNLHFRMIGFDACEMASEKMVEAVIPYAEFFVAASKTEAIDGWNYFDIVTRLADNTSDEELMNSMLNDYRDMDRFQLFIGQKLT